MRTASTIDQLIAHCALDTLPPVWVDLAHGRISAEDAAAEALEREPPELVERSQALFGPLSAAEQERELAELLEAHFPEPAAMSRSRGWIGLVSAAAAIALVVSMPLLMDDSPDDAQVAAFDAEYSLTMLRGYEGMRSAEEPAAEGATVYAEGRPVELLLRPRHGVSQTLAVRVFATSGERTLVLAVEPEVNEHGVVQIVGATDALGLTPGTWTLTAVIGPGPLPASVAEIAPEGGYEVVTGEIEVVPADELPSSG